ncbi:MAG: rhodanese-like domain-containing protein [Caldilineales bacterium]
MSDQSSSSVVCGACGATLRTGARFCTTCGAAADGAGASAHSRSVAGSSKGLWPILAAVAGLILLAAAAVSFLSKPETTTAPTNSVALPVITVAADAPYPQIIRVSAEQAHISMAEGQAVLIDVRDRRYFEAGHAAGALSIPESELPAQLGELPKDKTIITYCT